MKLNPDGTETYYQLEDDMKYTSRKMYRAPGGYVYSKKLGTEDDGGGESVLQWTKNDPRIIKKTRDIKKKVNFEKIEAMFTGDKTEENEIGPGPVPYRSLGIEMDSFHRWMDEFLVPAIRKPKGEGGPEANPGQPAKGPEGDAAPPLPPVKKVAWAKNNPTGPSAQEIDLRQQEMIPIDPPMVEAPAKPGVLPFGMWKDELCVMSSAFRKRLPSVEEIAETRYLYGPQKMIPFPHRRGWPPRELIAESKCAGLFLYKWVPVQVRMPGNWRSDVDNYDLDQILSAAQTWVLLGIFRFIDTSLGDTGPGYKDISAVPAENLKDYIVDVMRVNIVYLPQTQEDEKKFAEMRNVDLKEDMLFEKLKFKFGTYFLSLYGLK